MLNNTQITVHLMCRDEYDHHHQNDVEDSAINTTELTYLERTWLVTFNYSKNAFKRSYDHRFRNLGVFTITFCRIMYQKIQLFYLWSDFDNFVALDSLKASLPVVVKLICDKSYRLRLIRDWKGKKRQFQGFVNCLYFTKM